MIEIRTADLPEKLVEQMEGPVPPDYFVSNGCSYSPDRWIAVDIRAACHWHDYAYLVGGCKKDRQRADMVFFRNMRSCDLGKIMASLYFLNVRLFGVAAFNWAEGKLPANPWHHFLIIYDRFIKCKK